MNSLELAEDVGILRQDTTGLQHSHTEGEDAADLQLACQILTKTQFGLGDVAQLEV